MTAVEPTRDLVDEAEVGELVRSFYAEVAQDDLLGPLFNEVARVDWAAHLPKLAAFWCRFLFDHPGYAGNPFQAHKAVHDQRRFTPAHFRRWLELFEDALARRWAGPNVDRVLGLAHEVARVHQRQLLGTGSRADSGPADDQPSSGATVSST